MRRSVTFSVTVNGFAGTFQEVSHVLTSASSESSPRFTRRSVAVAVMGLLIDPAWKSVLASTNAERPASLTPKPRAHASCPCSTTAMLTPGTR